MICRIVTNILFLPDEIDNSIGRLWYDLLIPNK